MSDPYTEATRHERKRMPAFAKVFLVVGGLVATALVTVVVIAVIFVKRQVEEFAHHWEDPAAFEFASSDATTAEAVANAAEALFGDEVQISASDLDVTGLNPVELELSHLDLSELGLSASNIDGEEFRFDFDFSELEDGLREMETALETLIEEAAEKGIRLEGGLEGEERWFKVDCPDCSSRLELRSDGEGGSLRIRAPAIDARVELGDEAARLPRWVPTYPRARLHKRLFSGEKDGVEFGGVLHTSDAGAKRAYDWFKENLRGRVRVGRVSDWKSVWRDRRERGMIQLTATGLFGERRLAIIVWKNNEGNTSIVTMHKTTR